jgi:hypothetical protein
MNKVKILLVSVLGLSLLVLFVIPVKTAYTDEIPFRVKTDLTDLLFISCKGPFGRNSGCVHVEAESDFTLFYAAEINFFDPYAGEWRCDVYKLPICFGVAGRKTFRISRHPVPVTQVDLTIVECDGCFDDKYAIELSFAQTCCELSTSAFLGDRPRQFKPDKDTFKFQGTEGDEITLSLEEDGSVGHIGEQANFKLRGPIGSASLNEFRTGELSLEIAATIPESGEYEIVVDQKNIPDDLRYRGGYVITLDQSLDDVKEIVPSQDVE